MSKMTQEEYIAILFDDCGYHSAQRMAWLDLRFGKRYADELSTSVKAEKEKS
jgi:hypothetical protein